MRFRNMDGRNMGERSGNSALVHKVNFRNTHPFCDRRWAESVNNEVTRMGRKVVFWTCIETKPH